jgi:hypothetical protein
VYENPADAARPGAVSLQHLDRIPFEGADSLGELLTKAVRVMNGYHDKQAARFIVEFATRAVCEAIINEGADFPFWKLPELLRVDLETSDDADNGDDDGGDWWKQSGYSRN